MSTKAARRLRRIQAPSPPRGRPPRARSAVTSVTLTRAEYDSLLERIEDLEDAAELRDATARGRTNEALSAASVKRIVAGEHPLRVWRAHRGLSLTALARRAGIAASYVSEIESGKKPGSIAALKKFATALGIGVDDLVG